MIVMFSGGTCHYTLECIIRRTILNVYYAREKNYVYASARSPEQFVMLQDVMSSTVKFYLFLFNGLSLLEFAFTMNIPLLPIKIKHFTAKTMLSGYS